MPGIDVEALKKLSDAGLSSEQIRQLDHAINKSGFKAGGKDAPSGQKVDYPGVNSPKIKSLPVTGPKAPQKKAAPKTDFQTGFGQKNFLNPGKMVAQARAKRKENIATHRYSREAVARRMQGKNLRGRGGGK